MTTITSKAQEVLQVIANGNVTRDTVAGALDKSISQVNGSITQLKRNGLVEIDGEGNFSLTPDAGEFVTIKGKRGRKPAVQVEAHQRAARTGTKMEAARNIFDKYFDKGRQFVLEKFQTNVGLTEKGASTYFQTLRHETGVAAPAYQRGKKPSNVATMKKTMTRAGGKAHTAKSTRARAKA
jgi:hypothetical protein